MTTVVDPHLLPCKPLMLMELVLRGVVTPGGYQCPMGACKGMLRKNKPVKRGIVTLYTCGKCGTKIRHYWTANIWRKD